MKLVIRNQNLALHSTMDAQIEERLRLLRNRVRIEQAAVVVERRPEASPAYRVFVDLVVPGPDLRAERVDNTPQQAFNSAMQHIEKHLSFLERKRALRLPARQRRTSTPGQRATAYC